MLRQEDCYIFDYCIMSFRQGYTAFLFQDERGLEEEEEEGEDNSKIILLSIYYAINLIYEI